MAIWFLPITLDDLRKRTANTLVTHMGIEYVELGDDFISATMPVDHRTCQPLRLLHGGASCVLSETLGSVGASMVVNPGTHFIVGLEINANHVRGAREGETVLGVCKPLHLGRSTHVWETKIYNQLEKLVCISRLTVSVLNK